MGSRSAKRPAESPAAGVHNSGWVQSPGRIVLADNAKQDALESYVTDVLQRYAKDKRVLAWDLFNEPDNLNGNSYGPLELKNKDEVAARLVRKTFEWAERSVHRSRLPSACGATRRSWDRADTLNKVHRAAVELSDVISFHDYGKARIDERPHQAASQLRPAAACAPSSWPAATAARSKRSCRS